jgi:putative ABC transport system ATP-binding protein
VPTEGRYLLDGEDVGGLSDNKLAEIRNRHLGFVFQQYNLIGKLNVVENVELPLVYAGVPARRRRDTAMTALGRVGLTDRWHHTPAQLSGGQQQRVSIARALVGNPSVILADEPTGALDSHTGMEVLDFFKELNGEGNTVVLITHDAGVAAKARRIVRLSDGKILSDEPSHTNLR